MRSIGNTKGIGVSPYWRIAGIMVICAIIYYLPTFASIVGWTSAHGMLDGLHDFYGIDFYALVFFVPVVYAAYLVGVGGAVITALVAMLLILPYAIVVTNYAGALFRPTSFAIILSAVGAVIAMLQKNDEQRHRSLSELKCLYNVGRATEESHSVDEFLSAVVKVIPVLPPQSPELPVIADKSLSFAAPPVTVISLKSTFCVPAVRKVAEAPRVKKAHFFSYPASIGRFRAF